MFSPKIQYYRPAQFSVKMLFRVHALRRLNRRPRKSPPTRSRHTGRIWQLPRARL